MTAGVITDTTGTDGIYVLRNLDPGLQNVVVKHPTFDNDNVDVTAIAQEDATGQDFTLIPKLDRQGSLEVVGVGQNVYLTWLAAGSMDIGCGDKLITSLPYSDQGTNAGMGDEWDVAGGDGEDYTYTFYVFEDITITVDLCSPITDYDAKLEIFTADEFCVSTTTGYYDDDGINDGPCYSDNSTYFYFSWDGDCQALLLEYSDQEIDEIRNRGHIKRNAHWLLCCFGFVHRDCMARNA